MIMQNEQKSWPCIQTKNDPDKEEEWWEINTLVTSWILNTVELSLRSSINYFERTDE